MRFLSIFLGVVLLGQGLAHAESTQGEWVIPEAQQPIPAPVEKKTPPSAPPVSLPPSDFDVPEAPDANAPSALPQTPVVDPSVPPGTAEFAERVLADTQRLTAQLAQFLEMDGRYFNGKLTLKALSAMELDSAPVVRSLAQLFEDQWLFDRRRALSGAQRLSFLDIYESGQLRSSVLRFVQMPEKDFRQPPTGGSLRTMDFRLRNRIAFTLHFLDKGKAILTRLEEQGLITGPPCQALRNPLVQAQAAVTNLVISLQAYQGAYAQTGVTGPGHAPFFTQAAAATKGPCFVGMYQYDAGAIVYFPYGQAGPVRMDD